MKTYWLIVHLSLGGPNRQAWQAWSSSGSVNVSLQLDGSFHLELRWLDLTFLGVLKPDGQYNQWLKSYSNIAWVRVSVLSPTSCVNLGKLLKWSLLQFPQPWNKGNNNTLFLGLLWVLNMLTTTKCLKMHLAYSKSSISVKHKSLKERARTSGAQRVKINSRQKNQHIQRHSGGKFKQHYGNWKWLYVREGKPRLRWAKTLYIRVKNQSECSRRWGHLWMVSLTRRYRHSEFEVTYSGSTWKSWNSKVDLLLLWNSMLSSIHNSELVYPRPPAPHTISSTFRCGCVCFPQEATSPQFSVHTAQMLSPPPLQGDTCESDPTNHSIEPPEIIWISSSSSTFSEHLACAGMTLKYSCPFGHLIKG